MFIASTGMMCPVGLNAASACAAWRAGISAFAELPYCDRKGKPILGAVVPGVTSDGGHSQRLATMLAGALRDLMTRSPKVAWDQVPLLIGLAESDRPGTVATTQTHIIPAVQKLLDARFHASQSRTFATGHTSGFDALAEARKLLALPNVPAVVACGVDSFISGRTIFALNDQFRLKTAANRDGIIPGEAAAAVLLQKTRAAGHDMEIVGLGYSAEPASILSDKPLKADGLSQAARQALSEAKIALHEIDGRFSDVTGEEYGFREVSLLTGRLMRVPRKQDQPLWHWAQSIGDNGAAAGIAQLVALDDAFTKDYAPGRSVLCLTSSVAGGRAAAVVRRISTDKVA